MKTGRTQPEPKSSPQANWPAWTDYPIPYRIARPRPLNLAIEADHQREVDRLVRTRGGVARIVGRDAD